MCSGANGHTCAEVWADASRNHPCIHVSIPFPFPGTSPERVHSNPVWLAYNPDSDDVVHPYFTSLHAAAFGLGSGTGVEGVWYVILCDVSVRARSHGSECCFLPVCVFCFTACAIYAAFFGLFTCCTSPVEREPAVVSCYSPVLRLL